MKTLSELLDSAPILHQIRVNLELTGSIFPGPDSGVFSVMAKALAMAPGPVPATDVIEGHLDSALAGAAIPLRPDAVLLREAILCKPRGRCILKRSAPDTEERVQRARLEEIEASVTPHAMPEDEVSEDQEVVDHRAEHEAKDKDDNAVDEPNDICNHAMQEPEDKDTTADTQAEEHEDNPKQESEHNDQEPEDGATGGSASAYHKHMRAARTHPVLLQLPRAARFAAARALWWERPECEDPRRSTKAAAAFRCALSIMGRPPLDTVPAAGIQATLIAEAAAAQHRGCPRCRWNPRGCPPSCVREHSAARTPGAASSSMPPADVPVEVPEITAGARSADEAALDEGRGTDENDEA